MKRLDIVAFRQTLVTPDTAEAVRRLEMRAHAFGGVRLIIEGAPARMYDWASAKVDPGGTQQPPHNSMRNTGRELRIRLVPTEGEPNRQRDVEALWGLAVPSGFVPWNRYPTVGPGDDVFHYLGPWQVLYDSLLGEGRGEVAWPSLCVAAMVDVGTWEGDRLVERFVQTQMHRVGVACGAVDGIIGERTQASLRALGVKGKRLEEVAEWLATLEPPVPPKEVRRFGHLILPGVQAVATASGKVFVMKTPTGYSTTVDGPGRIVLDIG